ncbi:hypothetical protein [Alloactinosynnema sp. L-07]|uniref:hypothetical protein n=1 Tax=Alloactinosynnema sp. L-07 TaxID=1653480 RepID=UPI00065F0593|nr:hypothetical protein [Alloactinosynnema sp. L-07]CRK60953.1 hypothetical protein [Alloactinosynnema sp. L-07]
MAFTLEYNSTVNGVTYALTAVDDGTAVDLELIGAAESGDIVAEGKVRLPPGGATAAADLVRTALTAIATFEGKRTRTRVGNSHARWTPADDAVLHADWLRYPPSTPAVDAIRELATARQRSSAAIRARLGRLGCDPDVAGRLLSAEAAAVVGRNSVAGEIFIADVEAAPGLPGR